MIAREKLVNTISPRQLACQGETVSLSRWNSL